MSAAVRWCLLVLIFVVTVSGQNSKKTLPESYNSLQLADDVIAKDRSTRTIKKIQKKLGFFGTIKQLIFDQINDTKSAYNQISEMVNGNFADGNSQASKEIPSTSAEEDTEGTTTEPPPPKLTREDFLNVLRRNVIGLRRLFDEEWKLAMRDSKKNIIDYKYEIKNTQMFRT